MDSSGWGACVRHVEQRREASLWMMPRDTTGLVLFFFFLVGAGQNGAFEGVTLTDTFDLSMQKNKKVPQCQKGLPFDK